MSTPHLDLTSDDVLSLLAIAATSDLSPSATDPKLMAMVYRARTVIDVSDTGSAKVRAFTLTVRDTP